MKQQWKRFLTGILAAGMLLGCASAAGAADDGGYHEHPMGQVTLQTYALRTGSDGFPVYFSLNGYIPKTISVKTAGNYTAAEQQAALARGIDEMYFLPWIFVDMHGDSPVTDLDSLYYNLNNAHPRPRRYIYPTYVSFSEASYAIIQTAEIPLLGLSFHSSKRMVILDRGETPDYRSYTNYIYLDGQLVLEWTMSKNGYVTAYKYHDAYFQTVPEESQIAVTPTTSKMYVDGKEVSLGAYLIDDTNYIRLRDIASLLDGSPTQFDVAWHQESGQIELLPGQSYTPTGVELGQLSPATAYHSTSVITRQYMPLIANDPYTSAEFLPEAYNIGNNTFYKLRDIAHVADFTVRWDDETKSVHIISEKNDYSYLVQ